MDLGLDGKIALVAASSRGLGLAAATALGREGARLVMCARRQEVLEEAADRLCAQTGAEVHTVTADLATPEGPRRVVEAAEEQLGGLDILVTNIGGPPTGHLSTLDDAAWQAAFEAVVLSPLRLIRHCVPSMTRRGGGRIINIASVTAKQPLDGLLLSNALRPAVVGLAKSLADELAPHGILINTVCPGKMATERLLQLDQERAGREEVSVEKLRIEAQRQIPLGRYGQPEEVGALIAFLASGRASYITGGTFLCDGGFYRGLM